MHIERGLGNWAAEGLMSTFLEVDLTIYNLGNQSKCLKGGKLLM